MENFQNILFGWILSSGSRIVLIIIVAYVGQKIIGKVILKVIDHLIKQAYDITTEEAVEKRRATLVGVANATLKIVVWIAVGLMILSEFGIDIAPLIAGAGIIGLAFGFGGQYLVRDIIAGLFILIEDQYRKGDVVAIAGISGVVEDINLRRTVLRDLDGVEHHIPNGEITTTSNKTKIYSGIHLEIGVAYESDLTKVRKVLEKIIKNFTEDDKWKKDIIEKPSVWGVEKLSESEITIRIIGKAKPGKHWAAMRELRLRIKETFDKEHIEIPFQQTVVTLKK